MNKIIYNIRKFNEERDWEQFHDAKNLALSLSIEAAELNEAFLWKKAEEADIEKIKEELADVFIVAMNLAIFSGIECEELLETIEKKIDKNFERMCGERIADFN